MIEGKRQREARPGQTGSELARFVVDPQIDGVINDGWDDGRGDG